MRTIPKFKVSAIDFICSKLYKTKKLKILESVSDYINKKTSIDFILKKIMEFDKTKFILLNEHEMHALKLINQPSISLIYKGRIRDRVQELWSEFEFDEGAEKIEIDKLEQQFNKDYHSPVEGKIFELLEKNTRGLILKMNNNKQ